MFTFEEKLPRGECRDCHQIVPVYGRDEDEFKVQAHYIPGPGNVEGKNCPGGEQLPLKIIRD